MILRKLLWVFIVCTLPLYGMNLAGSTNFSELLESLKEKKYETPETLVALVIEQGLKIEELQGNLEMCKRQVDEYKNAIDKNSDTYIKRIKELREEIKQNNSSSTLSLKKAISQSNTLRSLLQSDHDKLKEQYYYLQELNSSLSSQKQSLEDDLQKAERERTHLRPMRRLDNSQYPTYFATLVITNVATCALLMYFYFKQKYVHSKQKTKTRASASTKKIVLPKHNLTQLSSCK